MRTTLEVPPADYARMVPGVPYTLIPVNGNPEARWAVKPGVTLKKEDAPANQ